MLLTPTTFPDVSGRELGRGGWGAMEFTGAERPAALPGGSQASMSMKVLGSPLQRLGDKTEVAHSAPYLASPLTSHLRGAVLVVASGAGLTFPNDVKLLEDSASSAKL
ncbi:peroxisomal 2,4-dienoyl-CoA reductase [(3E)-enoyl-CoA-producing]-like [Manis pentadactyla]|uniref:peroxisomal 2,4-dienoyl-CoA reductase [(3E)-enoyl-CoA-producing]-like n=1 Tax=Manis pentadactyla TaxID=143292 RepID=UPI00255CC4FA|nr:peroxisomal 2,4-dienoyl-CoA reductase [(3E)-enoyl-CoA-producing]-like [Manis pentadactyla]